LDELAELVDAALTASIRCREYRNEASGIAEHCQRKNSALPLITEIAVLSLREERDYPTSETITTDANTARSAMA
jgi:hypothetical protein